jgi:hypothetical protein
VADRAELHGCLDPEERAEIKAVLDALIEADILALREQEDDGA